MTLVATTTQSPIHRSLPVAIGHWTLPHIERLTHETCVVDSSDPGKGPYIVNHEQRTCTCPDFERNGRYRLDFNDERRCCCHLLDTKAWMADVEHSLKWCPCGRDTCELTDATCTLCAAEAADMAETQAVAEGAVTPHIVATLPQEARIAGFRYCEGCGKVAHCHNGLCKDCRSAQFNDRAIAPIDIQARRSELARRDGESSDDHITRLFG